MGRLKNVPDCALEPGALGRCAGCRFGGYGAPACSLGVWVANLDNGGTLLAPFHDFESKIPEDVKAKITTAEAAISAGSLDPITGKTTTK